MTLIKRADAIEVVHKHFTDAYDDLPTATDEDGDVIYKDTKSVNELLKHNKAISKELKALPSTDAISREEYEDIIKDYRKQYENMNNEIADLEAKLSADAEWIPCSERLPFVIEQDVLITTTWGEVTIANRWFGDKWFIHEGNTNAKTSDIVAWMPLPKPYREESEVEE